MQLSFTEKTRPPIQSGEAIDSKCTSMCHAMEGGVSCSKLLWVNVFSKEKPHAVHRVYAIIDEQSNSSLISTELANNWEQMDLKKSTFLPHAVAQRRPNTHGA